jgi:hypothetical protein
MKPKRRCFEAVSGIQKELQVVIDSIKENGFHGAFEAWKRSCGITIYVPKQNILKEMAVRIE